LNLHGTLDPGDGEDGPSARDDGNNQDEEPSAIQILYLSGAVQDGALQRINGSEVKLTCDGQVLSCKLCA
jgi:hypothetical protein